MSEKRELVVNENNEIIGAKFWQEMQPGDIKRGTALWVIIRKDSSYQVLIAQRKWTKNINPGKWGSSVAGTVEEGETYEDNIYKEAEEEIGLTGVQFTPMHDKPTFGRTAFSMRYVVIGDWKLSDFTPQESEVEALDLVDIDDLLRDSLENPDKYTINYHDKVIELKRYLENKT